MQLNRVCSYQEWSWSCAMNVVVLGTGQRVAPESRWSRVTSLTSTRKTSIASQTSTVSKTNTSRTSILTRTTTAASCPNAQLRIQVDQILSLPLSASLLSFVFWSLFPSFSTFHSIWHPLFNSSPYSKGAHSCSTLNGMLDFGLSLTIWSILYIPRPQTAS
jgi:hypothetical protein